MRNLQRTPRRPGTIVPMLAVTLVGLITLVALAMDIGLVAIARNQAQNAADAAALAGVRQLNGDTTNNNNYSAVAPAAQTAAAANSVLGTQLTASNLTTEIGYYAYDSTAQRFDPYFTGTKPSTENWTAVRTTVNVSPPTFFARVLGINSTNVTATATAVHRPRDIVIILDFSGSMGFSSEPAYPPNGDYTGSLNPDPAYPKFGHWSVLGSVMQRTTDYVDSGGEVHAANNYTVDTANGLAIVRDFLTRDSSGNLVNAFHNPTSPYDPMTFACPAPQDFDTQSSSTATYKGDLWPRYNKATTGSYARDVWNYLTNNEPAYSANHNKSTVLGPGGTTFEPLVPSLPLDTEGYGPNFRGYVLGPGYYGKSFFMWPPDPRFNPNANLTTPETGTDPKARDTSGRWMGDWRKRFFYNGGTTTPLDGDNSRLWSTSTGQWNQASSTTYAVNYNAILAWIKSGPKVLPDNLRAGRVLYYSAIPSTIPSSGLSQDQLFWKAYIDYVIGNGSATMQKQTGYGRQPDSDSSFGTAKITARSNIKGADGLVGTVDDPYMNYSDNPVRPRLQFWFGPLSMLCFLASNNYTSSYGRNWMPGTCHEAQCWQLKAGVNAALNDIQKNHPNDQVGMVFFSDIASYNSARVQLGRNYAKLKNCLFFPYSLLDSLSDTNAEVRPYDSSFNSTASGNIPNADGGTCPEMAFNVAYNELSSRSGYNGRRGATKMVIFETDGVPNTDASQSYVNGGVYNSYYSAINVGSYLGNGNSTVVTQATAAAQAIANLTTASPTGYSTTRNPARIHTIAFGELFESSSSMKTPALNFLLGIQKAGNTSSASATSIESYKIITGDYNTRIETIRQAFEHIMQSGVQVSLIR